MKYKGLATLIIVLTLAASGYAASNSGTFTQICTWNGGWPPNCPTNSLVMDKAGNLYGTSGYLQYSAVNELSPAGDGDWTASTIFTFDLYTGWSPSSLAIDKAGNLYGATSSGGLGTNQILCGGEQLGCGTIYELSPPATSGGDWTGTTLYYFQGLSNDGGNPGAAVTLNSATPSRMFGTAGDQGAYGCGTVFELNYSKSNSWTEKTLYNFPSTCLYVGGGGPGTGVIKDKTGNLYGADGTQIYKLTPAAKGQWTFTNIWGDPTLDSGVIDVTFGPDGNIYGTCGSCVSPDGGVAANGYGQVFELALQKNREWKMNILHKFGAVPDAAGLGGGVVFDKDGNIYGVSAAGGIANSGAIYELTKSKSGKWKETTLHSFPHSTCDYLPVTTLLVDKSGNLYGTDRCGNNFKFTP